MSDHTKIEWADATVNAVNGCSVVSPGCTNCYAMRLAGTRMKHHPSRAGLTQPSKAGPAVAEATARSRAKPKHVWTGEVRLSETALLQPLKWKRPRRIFWNAHGDLFHENVPDEWIDRVFAVCALTPQHTHIILTKRSARMREYVSSFAIGGRMACDTVFRILAPLPNGGYNSALAKDQDKLRAAIRRCGGSPMHPYSMPNVWLGVSVEDQTRADERIPDLLATPAAIRFISAEPLLGPVDLNRWLDGTRLICQDCGDTNFLAADEISYVAHAGEATALCPRCGCMTQAAREPHLDWVICGGESGPGARPMHPDWARSLRDQCAAAGVAFHFKQWGEWRAWQSDDAFTERDSEYNPKLVAHHIPQPGEKLGAENLVLRLGKKHAGRLLDGRTHDEFPAGAA